MNCYFFVFARDKNYVKQKIDELSKLKIPYTIICGEKFNHPNVVYRKAVGKYDAINFASKLLPKDIDVVILNDVDTKIHNFNLALSSFKKENAALLFTKVVVNEGPQRLFYLFQDELRRKLLVACEGELMLIDRKIFDKILPLKPCKAEDTYILFKVMEFKKKVIFFEGCYCETERTKIVEKEKLYKKKTVGGIYQALSYTKPPLLIRVFYAFLPFLSPIFLILGKNGFYWTKGILLGFVDFLRGDRSGFWMPVYK